MSAARSESTGLRQMESALFFAREAPPPKPKRGTPPQKTQQKKSSPPQTTKQKTNTKKPKTPKTPPKRLECFFRRPLFEDIGEPEGSSRRTGPPDVSPRLELSKFEEREDSSRHPKSEARRRQRLFSWVTTPSPPLRAPPLFPRSGIKIDDIVWMHSLALPFLGFVHLSPVFFSAASSPSG